MGFPFGPFSRAIGRRANQRPPGDFPALFVDYQHAFALRSDDSLSGFFGQIQGWQRQTFLNNFIPCARKGGLLCTARDEDRDDNRRQKSIADTPACLHKEAPLHEEFRRSCHCRAGRSWLDGILVGAGDEGQDQRTMRWLGEPTPSSRQRTSKSIQRLFDKSTVVVPACHCCTPPAPPADREITRLPLT